jgi:exopolysaccharide/PEP-CTERM locus tyrosine autokinase
MGKFYDALKKWQEETARPGQVAAPRPEAAEQQAASLEGPAPSEAAQATAAAAPADLWAPLKWAGLGGQPLGGRQRHLLINNGTDPAIVEQYKMLRTQLLHYHNGQPPRTTLITSTLQGEGKSTVAANLAIAIARSVKEHVLLIDCDLREPSLHRLFGLRPAQGLANHLRTGVPLEELLLRTPVDKLSFLPAGPRAADAAELLSSERMRSLLAEVKSRYEDRFILLDSTPLLPTTDPTILAAQVDAILLVVRANMANRELIGRVVETVGREKIMGVVFNGAQPSPTSYAYKYYSSAYRYQRD